MILRLKKDFLHSDEYSIRIESDSKKDYRLIRAIGRGGFGEVYEAIEESTKQKYAIKILNGRADISKEQIKRILKIEEIAGNIIHPNLLRVHSVYEEEKSIVMEFLEGLTLKQIMYSNETISEQRVFELINQIASGLKALHAQEIIHRDVKPDNIIIAPFAKIIDYGLATKGEKTTPGKIIGTDIYMSHKQFLGNHRKGNDIYTLGLIVCEMLNGRRKFSELFLESPERQVSSEHILRIRSKNKAPEFSAFSQKISEKMRILITMCLSETPPSASELLEYIG